jgi:hypothetical protein
MKIWEKQIMNSRKTTSRASRKKIFFILCCAMLILAVTPLAASAANQIVITGDTQSFKIVSGGTQLYENKAMLPGESGSFMDLEISNTQSLPYTLSIAVRDLGSDASLLNFMNIVVRLDGNVIASFPAKGQISGYQNPYPFGLIMPGVTALIETGLELEPGAGMDNSLQETEAHFEWILTAVSDQSQPEPPVPDGGASTAGGTDGGAGGGAGGDVSPAPEPDLPIIENIDPTDPPLINPEDKPPTGLMHEGCPCWFCPWCNLIIVILALLVILFLILYLTERRKRKKLEERLESYEDGTMQNDAAYMR